MSNSVLGLFLFIRNEITLFADDTTENNHGWNTSHEITSDITRGIKLPVTNKLIVIVKKYQAVGFGRVQHLLNNSFGHCYH